MHQAAQQAIQAMFPCPDDSLPHLEQLGLKKDKDHIVNVVCRKVLGEFSCLGYC